MENLGPPTNSIRRRQSVSRPNREEAREDALEDDGQTTVDWTADADLVRQIDADRVSALPLSQPLLSFPSTYAQFTLLLALTAESARRDWAARGWAGFSRWDACPGYTRIDCFSSAHCER